MKLHKNIEMPHGIKVKHFKADNGKDGFLIESDLIEGEWDKEYIGAISGVESMILAHAVAGVDIESDSYKQGVSVAIESICNKLL